MSAAVVQTSAYSSRGTPDTTNASDNIYGSDGDKLVVPLTADGSGGYAGTFVAGLTGLPETTTSGRVQDRARAHHDPKAAGLVAAEGGGSAAPFARRRVALLRSSPPRRSRAGPICRRTT